MTENPRPAISGQAQKGNSYHYAETPGYMINDGQASYFSKIVTDPVLRDKVVLNVVDGLQACYDGGPGANPKFIYDASLLLLGTDPVAVDAVAHDVIVKERMARGTQQVDDPRRRSAAFLDLAAGLGLGVADRDKIKIGEVSLG